MGPKKGDEEASRKRKRREEEDEEDAAAAAAVEERRKSGEDEGDDGEEMDAEAARAALLEAAANADTSVGSAVKGRLVVEADGELIELEVQSPPKRGRGRPKRNAPVFIADIEDFSRPPELFRSQIADACYATSTFNAQLAAQRQGGRVQVWFDANTNIMQAPRSRTRPAPSSGIEVHQQARPVRVMPRQFANPLHIIPSSELKKTSMRTTVDAPPRGTAAATAARALGGEFELPERRETPSLVARVTSTQSAPVDIIVEEALPAKRRRVAPVLEAGETRSSASPALPRRRLLPSLRGFNKSLCAHCQIANGETLLTCVTCASKAHAACLELSPAMEQRIHEQGGWECHQCKLCSVCHKAGDEEQLMMCDLCDIGAHSYCMNLDEPPAGQWLCVQCTSLSATAPSDRKKTR